ncbi:MAG: TIGR03503 family protein [Pseudomonadota bacterium]
MMAFACAKAHASTDEVEAILSKIRPIENTNLNDIQILDNRFRIDDDVEEVTLIFFRAKGSPPIVLVRPDGSKFHLDNDSTNDDYTWHETDTYDMISLARPMPGPWQAVGKILPESRLIVIANINLKIDPLPKTIFQGESIKLTAQLENAGSHVELVEFRDVVALSLEFSSSNNPNYDNFGLGTRTIARFEDDGMGFDERARDKIFTGQFLANVTAGEWQPIASVRTPLLSREKRLPNVIVEKAPVTVSHVAEAGTDGYHTITVEGDEQWIDVKSVLIDGTVRQPNGDTQRIAFTEITDGPKVIDTLNVGYGVYAIHLSVFARSVDGRDLVINLPRYSFTTEPPPAPPEEAVAEEVAVDMVLPPEEEAPNYVLLVLAINLCILLISALIIFTIIDKRKHGSNLWFKRLWSGMLALLPKKKVVEAPAAAE